MLEPDLLNLLCCPETRQGLHLADEALIQQLNQKIDRGELLNRNGGKIVQKLEAGLVRADGQMLYAIRNEIPVMLVEEGIPLS